MASSARGWSNHPSSDEVSEAIVWCVEWSEFRDRATPIRDDHLFAGHHAIDVLAETILEVANPDLRPRSSYIHIAIVDTLAALSTQPGGRVAVRFCTVPTTTRAAPATKPTRHAKAIKNIAVPNDVVSP